MTGPLDGPPLDIGWLIRVLDRYEVDYLLVGGVAARIYGATRATLDFDCVPRRSESNLSRLATAMRELNARLRVEGLSDDEAKQLPVVIDQKALDAMEIGTWMTDAGGLDVLQDIRDGEGRARTYDDLAERAVIQPVDRIQLRLAALDDIIESKEWADRPKDREALPEIRRIRDGHLSRKPDDA